MLSLAVLGFLFVTGVFGLVLVNGETLEPNDSHVVTLYADGVEYDIPTRSRTVGELLEKANITLAEHDIVEPSIEDEITVDGFRIRVARARPYVIDDGDKKVAAMSAHTSARLIAESAGLDIKSADLVEFAPIEEVPLTEIGRVVKVIKSKQVRVFLYGNEQLVSSNARTVSDLLTELNITPADEDQIQPGPNSVLADGMVVAINRNGVQVVTEEIAIDPPVEYVTDLSLTLGSTAVRDPGKPGKRIVTYEITLQNDQEVSRREISSAVVEHPVTKVVARGRAAGAIGAEKEQLMAAAGIPAEEYGAVNYIIGQESGWCATKWQGQWGRCPEFYIEKFEGAEESSSLGYGLCQSTPAIKMASLGEDWRTNPVTQLRWCYGYMLAYGSAQAAADFKQCLGECYSPRTRSTVFKKTTWF